MLVSFVYKSASISQEIEWSLCVRSIDFTSFYDFAIEFWNCLLRQCCIFGCPSMSSNSSFYQLQCMSWWAVLEYLRLCANLYIIGVRIGAIKDNRSTSTWSFYFLSRICVLVVSILPIYDYTLSDWILKLFFVDACLSFY
jgi:hypothetical protein